MIRKRVKAGLLVATLAVSVLFAGGNVCHVNAAASHVSGLPDGYVQASKISRNDLSKTTGEVGTATYTDSEAWVCPTNNSYYVANLQKYENGMFIDLTDDEWDAFRSKVESQNLSAGSDETLTDWSSVAASEYTASEVTVVNGSTKTTLPHEFGESVTGSDGKEYDLGTYYYLSARTTTGEWKGLLSKEAFDSDYTFSWSDYLSDEYVYFDLYSKEYATDANTGVHRFFVGENKLDDMRAMFSPATISDVKSSTIEPGVEGTMYRMYNPNSGEHFYTANVVEAQNLKNVGWNYEGYAWVAPETSNTPVYRLYNKNSGEHHYTTSVAERDMLAGIGWNDEGIGWYSDDSQTTPLYRLYNPNATGAQEAGSHHYTTSAAERDMLVGLGWNDENVGWYGL